MENSFLLSILTTFFWNLKSNTHHIIFLYLKQVLIDMCGYNHLEKFKVRIVSKYIKVTKKNASQRDKGSKHFIQLQFKKINMIFYFNIFT